MAVAPLDIPTYEKIQSCVAGPGVCLETGASSLYNGCKCAGDRCATEHSCTCRVAYDREGHLHESYLQASSPPVFECNSNCTCSSACPNRTTQCHVTVEGDGGMTSHLCVVQTERKGFGVCSLVGISTGTFVGEYVGEVITGSQAKERLSSQQLAARPCYIVQYREHTGSGTVVTTNIDATYKGNIMRFVNHSCSPNLVMVAVRSDSVVPRLCLFASQPVSPEEELCFSYYGASGAAVDKETLHLGTQPCYCGSESCVNFLPLDLL